MRRSPAIASPWIVRLSILSLFFVGLASHVSAQTLQSISVTPSSATIPVGVQLQFTATGNYSDGSRVDLTSAATWLTSKGTIAAVNAVGLATGESAGTTIITATYNGVKGSASLTASRATLKSISVSPTNATVAVNCAVQFTATGLYSNGKSYNVSTPIVWSSSTSSATINPAGQALGVSAGTTTITASAAGVTSGSTSLTVKAITLKSIGIKPLNASLPAGRTLQYTATGAFSDGSTADITASVAWGSAKTAAATIKAGLATGVAAGVTAITATKLGISKSMTLTVTPSISSISVSPSSAYVPLGLTQQFRATANYSDGTTVYITKLVSWKSSVPAVATISNTAGTVGNATSVATGTTNITAAYQGITTAPAPLRIAAAALSSIAVSPQTPAIARGTSQLFSATGTYTNGSTKIITSSVAWLSSVPAVAAIGSGGLALSRAVGTTTISAMSGSISGATTLAVTPATLVSITMTPLNPSVPKGASQQFAATGTYTDGSTQDLTSSVQWASGDRSVASINVVGNATAASAGTAQITATFSGIVGQATMTVGPATLVSIAVAPADPSIALGTKQQFTAAGTYTDGSTEDLTASVAWSCANTSIATISTSGQATSQATGSTTVSAASGSITDFTVLTVTSAVLVSMAVTPAIPSEPLGEAQQFTATGTFTDGTIQDVTNTVTWGSSDATIATISMTTPTRGLAQTIAVGTTTITASSTGISGSTALTVNPAVITSISVMPSPLSFAKGTTQRLSATATYSDNGAKDITSTATWSSADATVATVNAAGLATAVQVGTTTIIAASSGVTGTTSVQVTPAVLVSIAVTPPSASIPLGTTQQFGATGTYSDGSTQDVTTSVHWTSSAGTVATISMAPATVGLATSTGTGTATITATSGSISGAGSLTVTPAALVSIAIAPSTPTIALGQSQQFTATGTYTDSSAKDITTNVTWSTSLATVAIVSNSVGSNGLATSSGVGTATITATSHNIRGSTTLTVGVPQIVSIAVTPSPSAISVGLTQPFTATATYTDNTTGDVTNSVGWSSSNSLIATVNNSGVATGVSPGLTTIAATSGLVQGSTSLSVIALPSISGFTASSATITVGTSSTLTPIFSGGSGVINPGAISVTSGISIAVSPTTTTTYTLAVTNTVGSSSTQAVTVTVVAAPSCSLTASSATITSGTSTTLTGVFSGGTGVVTPGNVAITSGAGVVAAPLATTTYTLTVTNAAGSSATSTFTVAVVAPPSISSFTSSPATIPAGNTSSLMPIFGGGSGIITPGNIVTLSGSSVAVSPINSTIYTLTVTNAAGTAVQATASVTVVAAVRWAYLNQAIGNLLSYSVDPSTGSLTAIPNSTDSYRPLRSIPGPSGGNRLPMAAFCS